MYCIHNYTIIYHIICTTNGVRHQYIPLHFIIFPYMNAAVFSQTRKILVINHAYCHMFVYKSLPTGSYGKQRNICLPV